MACNYSKMPVNQTYISKEQCENTLTVMVHVHEIMHRCFLQNCASEKKNCPSVLLPSRETSAGYKKLCCN